MNYPNDYCQGVIDAVKNYSYKPILWPNPVGTSINIGSDDKVEFLEVFDIQGRLILRD